MKIIDWIIFENANEKKAFVNILSGDESENLQIKGIADKFGLTILEAKRFRETYIKKQKEK